MDEQRLKLLLEKYIANNCTNEEYSELLKLVGSSDDLSLETLLDEMYDKAPETKMPNRAAKKMLNKILQRPTRTVPLKMGPILWAAAASVLLLVTFGIYNLKTNNRLVPHTDRSILAKTKDDHQLIKLPDGSTVVLNKNSYVNYPEAFTGKLREVTLVGEGYFDIQHDAKKPFIVHVGKLSVTVLGTAFNIHSTSKDIAVTVTRGKVSVSDPRKTLGAILPDQQIIYDLGTDRSRRSTLNARHVIQWQANDIYFDDVTMDQAVEVLSQRFNRPINIANEQLKQCKLTGAFTHGESLSEILKVICEFNNTTFEDKKEQILITGSGCQPLSNQKKEI